MEVVEKKEMVHKDVYENCGEKEYASKGVAGTGLGLGIAGTALRLLALSGRGLFGLGNTGSAAAGALAAEAITGGPTTFQAWQTLVLTIVRLLMVKCLDFTRARSTLTSGCIKIKEINSMY